MKISICVALLFFSTITGYTQFKNDNVLYKTVDPSDLCSELKKNKGYLLLDVRSKGEHHDTSSFASLNLGHFKGAKNIDINELGKRLNELQEYKDQPIFVYCSHSQRSRRAGKMLADSGFTKVYNVNGGMTAFHYKALKGEECINSIYETNNNYEIISFNELCTRAKKNNAFILDVRTDSAFRHITKDPKMNALGSIRNSLNVPLADLQTKLSTVPNDGREIIVVDMFGGEAAKAAVILKKSGYQKVSMLIEGVDRILSTDSKELPCKNELFESAASFATFNAIEFGRYIKSKQDYVLLDIRNAEEFENKHKDSWRNLGRLQNAINIPVDNLEKRQGELDKNKDIIVYGFSSGPEVYKAATVLQQNGFARVKLLVGGLFNVRWSSGNVKGQSHLKDLVVDVPEVNQ